MAEEEQSRSSTWRMPASKQGETTSLSVVADGRDGPAVGRDAVAEPSQGDGVDDVGDGCADAPDGCQGQDDEEGFQNHGRRFYHKFEWKC